MIHVLVTYRDPTSKTVSAVKIQGHGNSGKGYDLVCAGVSSCFVGAMNALHRPQDFRIVVKSGDSIAEAKKEPTSHDLTVLETLVIQLATIEKSYPEDVEIRSVPGPKEKPVRKAASVRKTKKEG
jgi:uncharacterized protein YsxB (DUF464 family)